MENQLITLLRITTPQLGSFVKNKLEQEGIEVFFTNEEFSVSDKYNPNEVLLKVKAGHSEKAIETLLQIHKDYDLEMIKTDESISDLKKILVPVKISEDCINLCLYAFRLAAKLKAEVKILYAYADPTFNEPDRHTASWEKFVELELNEAFQKAQEKMVNFSKNLKEKIPKDLFDSVKVHYRMLKGTPINVISGSCKRYLPNLILMGTKSNKGADGEFISKTLVKVIENVNCPVLAVPSLAVYEEKEKINVMYATDFYNSDNSSLNKLLEILEPLEKKIHCVHIDLHDDPHHEEKAEELNRILETEYSEHNIRCILFESDNIIKGINEYVLTHDIDIISLSKMKRSVFYKMFHSDLIATLATVEKIPILIFPV
jgi:nucleotide-binding universal stress UspA family protein